MKRTWVLSCALVAGALAAAVSARAEETWMPLEALTPREQAQVIDSAERQKPGPNAGERRRKAAAMHRKYAEYRKAVTEAGADLLVGLR